MKLEDVKTIKDIANYSEALANDIEAGVTDDNGICNAQLIAEFAIHCAELVINKIMNEME